MRLCLSSAVAVALLAIADLAVAANAPAPLPSDDSPSPSARAGLGRVTIEADKRRQALRHQVDHFVAAIVAQPWDDALYRWTSPVCPLVAGLPEAEGEFILERISQAAVDAHAPLDGRACRPNLYVIVTRSPDLFLEKWWASDRRMYEYDRTGIEPVKAFLHSRLPIRVWYNTSLRCGEGVPPGSGAAFILGVVVPEILPPGCPMANSRLRRSTIGTDISSAIVVVDLRQMKGVTMKQMADYISLVGLTNARLDADSAPEPSILGLFDQATAPQGLSTWDRALLYALYNTNQWDYLQLSEVKALMVSRLTR